MKTHQLVGWLILNTILSFMFGMLAASKTPCNPLAGFIVGFIVAFGALTVMHVALDMITRP